MYKFITVFMAILFLSACDSFPHVSYSLGSADKYVLTGKIDELCNQLSAIAEKHQLVKRVPLRDNTQCYFSDSERNWIVLGARTLNEKLIVDVEATNRDKEFELVKSDLIQLLDTHYSGEYHEFNRYQQ